MYRFICTSQPDSHCAYSNDSTMLTDRNREKSLVGFLLFREGWLH